MKYKLLLVLLLGMFLISFASASTYEESIATYNSAASTSSDIGIRILATNNGNITHVGVMGAGTSVKIIDNVTGTTLANNPITTGTAVFTNVSITSGKYYNIYIVGTGDKGAETPVSFPLVKNLFTVTSGLDVGGVIDTTHVYGVTNITSVSGVATPIIILEYPLNDSTLSDVGTNFTVSGNNLSSLNANWTNVTYTIWNSTGDIHNSTVIDFTNNETFNETLFIDDFTVGTYIWNALACYENVTGDYCVSQTNNNTFDVVPFTTLLTTYSPTSIEGSYESFSTNISIISLERMSTVQFVYAGTNYAVTPIEYATNEWYLPVSITIPETATNINNSFYWSVRLESGLVYNTTSLNQTVYNIGIDNCSSYTNQLFNLTMYDETTQSLLVGATDNTSIKVSLTLSDSNNNQIVNFSKFYNQTNPSRVCLNYPLENSTLYLDAVIEYSRTSGFVEFYNIQNYELTNSTQSQIINLYNLKQSEGQEFKVTYKGLDFVPVSDVIIQIQRKYIDEGVFKTIEIPMSGTNGYTIAHLIPNDVIYNLIFIKNGVLLDTFTDVIATCQNPSFTDCEINLNSLVSGTDLIGLVEETDFFSSLSYNTDTRTISSTFGITSGVAGNTSLKVYLLDNFGTTEVCSDSLIAAGGTLSCTVPEGFGNSTVHAVLTLNGEKRREGYISMNPKPKELYGSALIFMSIIMFLFILGIAIQDNPMMMGIFLVLGLVILIGLNLVYSTSWIGVGATVLWFVVAIIMVLIKGGKR